MNCFAAMLGGSWDTMTSYFVTNLRESGLEIIRRNIVEARKRIDITLSAAFCAPARDLFVVVIWLTCDIGNKNKNK